ncbi:hypothetical protein J2847_006802 [Azospirillum agricola]|uniref:hypothetical protein n=1 Tax=Azospirillum agricola TaxID=1720247 RepID=UPI001AE896EF|nr:hypothetical protein [Azospirillum agricola]MBP2233464.1 hypothetical protein [Azospirillum agricola]
MAVAFAQPAADRRRALDLEALLVWAIRDQKADRDHAAWFETEAIVCNAERAGISYHTGSRLS